VLPYFPVVLQKSRVLEISGFTGGPVMGAVATVDEIETSSIIENFREEVEKQ
jgi:hypothetical protein